MNRSATLWTERGAWHLAVTPISVYQRSGSIDERTVDSATSAVD